MSLRKVKSLPSFRCLAEAANPLVKAPPLPITLLHENACSSLGSSASNFSVRTVHNTPKKEHTSLISNNKKYAAFTVMSLKSLRNECRSRGLKVSGKKSELVERIMAFESERQSSLLDSLMKKANTEYKRKMSSAARATQSHINTTRPVDKVKIPDIAATEAMSERKRLDRMIQVPFLSKEAAESTAAKFQNGIGKYNGAGAVSEFEQEGTVLTANDDLRIESPIAAINKIEILNDEAEESNKNNSEERESSELNSRDKKFLFGFTAAVAVWWLLGRKRGQQKRV
ncbi:Aim34p Ecym_3039 [Eremothecium cymbalariae DBVPG|uniref:SAP domain-containing protein n=1 Tax=Eremothecium cymbalariae (strain CBS 270.75 / DBVPG 7215 / KCTC 17166 / NRRL Y-17582) TaxID=931890 RepID=G8JQY4_ERECY|nr:Hypothetical protein Ecym_3039 [Eremothecium cymbalariae DBVPG\